MPKKIVLFSDGTGNSSGKAEKTNVWRMYQALNSTNADQLAKYDDGVGTSSFKLLAVIGGVFGWGLKRNVIDLYKFVCRNYVPKDEIYAFGFSRGSFTIRVLVGLIVNQGLVGFRSEEELNHNSIAVYRRYRSECFLSINPVVPMLRWLRDCAIALADWVGGYVSAAPIAQPQSVPIRFLGLWDTVEAYGMPIDELKRGIDFWIWPMVFGDKSLSPLVQRACHALSLDDERKTFHPLLWDEQNEAELIAQAKVQAGRLTQVWFAGVHSNVGGGYPDDQLSLVPLEWMMHEAMDNGLDLDKKTVMEVSAAKSPYARLYDSRAGFGAYYRYEPRRASMFVADSRAHHVHPSSSRSRVRRLLASSATKAFDTANNEILPIVDSSVVMRMAYGSDQYAPITLPHEFWVMAPDGTLIAMHGPGAPIGLDNTKQNLASPAVANQKTAPQITAEMAKLNAAIGLLSKPNFDAIRLVWDTVWWRRLSYFLTVALTAILASYPWFADAYARFVYAMLSPIPYVGPHVKLWYADVDHADLAARGLVESAVNAFQGLIPSYFSKWTEALITHPVEFVSIAICILLCLIMSQTLQSRIRDRGRLAWHGSLRKNYFTWSLDRGKGARNGVALAFVIALGALIALIAAYLFELNPQKTIDKKTIEIGIITLCLGVLLLWRAVGLRKFKAPGAAQPATSSSLPSTNALRFARWLRDNEHLRAFNRWMVWGLIPALFAFIVVAAGLAIANRAAFDVASSMGNHCTGGGVGDRGPEILGAASGFSTDRKCWPTGLRLVAGHRYRITLDASNGDWFDKSIRTDPGGFGTDGLRHIVASPLKRWWLENWFQPIGRIGVLGNDEYVLKPNLPFDPVCNTPFGPMAYKGCENCKTDKPMGEESIPAKISDAAAAELTACWPVPQDRLKIFTNITAKTSGELFIYVNDAVLAWPGIADYFYRNNRGTSTVSVSRVYE
jgi:uncharacterized protein (DUF2235 family)